MLTNARSRLAALVAAITVAACTPAKAPAGDPVAAAPVAAAALVEPAPAPRLLDPGMRTALTTQTAIVDEASSFVVSELLPPPPSGASDADPQVEAAPEVNAADAVPDAKKIALVFTGHDVGELDPCG